MTPTSPARSALPRTGDVVAGKYRIEKVVGEGGMGVVYAAHHLVLDQRVALKLMLVDAETGGETVERFVREAQAAARLQGDHVVRVTDAGALESGMPFLVMEFLIGCDLSELLSVDGRLSAMDTADYVLQASSALAQAHAAGIVHRDIKPANLFLTIREDATNAIKVLDFGISKQQSSRPRWKELTGKTVLGTPAYISPEQLRSSKNVDPRADLWSLGVVMYELLTGRVPFDGEGPGEIFAAILEKQPLPLRTHRPELPEAWEALVDRCLRRNPEQRFQSALELARALAPLGSGRWNHLLDGMEQAARSAAARPRTDFALVEAAVAAAITSFPPPSQPLTTRLPGLEEPASHERGAAVLEAIHAQGRARRGETLATSKTLAARVSPVAARPGAIAAVSLAAALTVGVVSIATVVMIRRPSATPGPPSALGATSAPLDRARADGPASVESPPPAIESPQPASADAVPAPAAIPGDAIAPPAASAAASTLSLSSVERSVGPIPPGSAARSTHRPAGSAGARPGPVDSRPKFLKSWR